MPPKAMRSDTGQPVGNGPRLVALALHNVKATIPIIRDSF